MLYILIFITGNNCAEIVMIIIGSIINDCGQMLIIVILYLVAEYLITCLYSIK